MRSLALVGNCATSKVGELEQFVTTWFISLVGFCLAYVKKKRKQKQT